MFGMGKWTILFERREVNAIVRKGGSERYCWEGKMNAIVRKGKVNVIFGKGKVNATCS